ncbi:MAG TPA: cytochrome d ubiquinol oxidase subunit II [Chryseolinea sp.]|nr:cytochrome d ubiquinol oxidase subunit II [Chryseolinea sp.]
MDKVVIVYLALSILLYLLLGGADFGAGIIEMFTSSKNIRRTRKTLYHAIGPIWEANHMWLIIAIVILFVGFPTIYSILSVYLHIPLVIMLMGIVARGTAFTFRHYDAVHDSMQEIYNRIFVWSSFITPLFLGIIAGSTLSGHIDTNASSFPDAYVFGWLNGFSVSVGLFTVSLCGFLAAVYLIGEADDENDRLRFIRKARGMNIISICAGTLVFVVSAIEKVPLVQWIFEDIVGLVATALALLSLLLMWRSIKQRKKFLPRILAAFQVAMILLAITYAHFPTIVILKEGTTISLLESVGPIRTINALANALLIGSVLILPALFYLYYSFQKEESY